MNNKRTNIILIIILLLNVAFLGCWWFGHWRNHHKMKHPAPVAETSTLLHDRNKGDAFLIKALGLDSTRQKEFEKLQEEHFSFMDKYMGSYISCQDSLFNCIKEGKDSSAAYIYADSLGRLKVIMEKEMFRNFSGIKSLCTPEQQLKLNGVMNDIYKEFEHRHTFHGSSPQPLSRGEGDKQDSL